MRQHTTQRTDVQHLVVTGVRRRSRCARRRARRAAAPRSRSTRAPPPERCVERVERETRRQGAAEDDRRVEHVAPRCATTECDRTRNALNARDARARRASVVTCDRALLKAVTHGRSVGARRAACARTRSGSERAWRDSHDARTRKTATTARRLRRVVHLAEKAAQFTQNRHIFDEKNIIGAFPDGRTLGKDGALAPLAPHISHTRRETLILPRVDVALELEHARHP